MDLPRELHRRLEKAALSRGTSMNAMVNSAVVAFGKKKSIRRDD
ncbi:hypothetical protein ACPOL_7215 (plasmid) [Acidisarcina polymorpha]|uniref:HicB family protein n=1 Tax=Acidisarcina polymorpha TaxID=2211140 RepID=A0A2Z5GCQ3_9BACT|nr:hypothetical protein ACPOL_7215 [Acidisarcina polymorpha]